MGGVGESDGGGERGGEGEGGGEVDREGTAGLLRGPSALELLIMVDDFKENLHG